MSKAFTKENDQAPEAELEDDATLAIPHGGKNYITPVGAKKLQDEFDQLHRQERPAVVKVVAWAAGNGDRSENADYIYGKRRLREIDRRLRFLSKRLDAAEIIDPAKQQSDSVRFGATVVIGDESGKKRTYSIVGIDETNLARGHVSWISPIGKSLLQAKVGDVVTLRAPRGEEELEILEIRYEPILTAG